MEQLDIETVLEVSRTYYWSIRAKAHDIFVVAADQKRRELRIRKTENNHYASAGALLDQILPKFNDPEWIEELSAKEAIEALETLMKIQRLSLGLTGQNSSSLQQGPRGASTELIMRQISKESGVAVAQENMMDNQLAMLLADESYGAKAQELILRVQTFNQ
jgi:hypothetical protein